MAKKFYYHGKSNPKTDTAGAKAQPTVSDNEANAVKTENPNGKKPQKQNGDKKFDRNHGKAQKQNSAPASTQSYSKESVSIPLESVGVSPATCELLAKNHINTLGDLVVRSEKDMFKVQGFNKRMLFELRDAMRSKGMNFKPEQPKPEKKAQNQPSQNSQKNKKNGQQKAQAKPEKQAEKLTEPLPVDRWRKIQKGGKWGFYDGFKTVIPASYDEVFCFKEGLASVELDEKCGYIDSENNVVIPFEYETAMSFSEGLASVSKITKFGYINKENQVVIPFEYDAATPFENGEAKVKKDGRWGTITPDGEVKWII